MIINFLKSSSEQEKLGSINNFIVFVFIYVAVDAIDIQRKRYAF